MNSQVLLKGIETRGYVILSAAKAEILQRVHHPIWKERSLVPKTTWVGSLECMQYYATVSANIDENIDDNIMWLTLDNIQVCWIMITSNNMCSKIVLHRILGKGLHYHSRSARCSSSSGLWPKRWWSS